MGIFSIFRLTMKILTSQDKRHYVFDGKVSNKFGQLIRQRAHAETWAYTIAEAKRNIHYQLTTKFRLGKAYPLVINDNNVKIVDDESTVYDNSSYQLPQEDDNTTYTEIDDNNYHYKYNNYIIYYNTVTNYYDIFDTHYHLIAKNFIDEKECEEYIDNL